MHEPGAVVRDLRTLHTVAVPALTTDAAAEADRRVSDPRRRLTLRRRRPRVRVVTASVRRAGHRRPGRRDEPASERRPCFLAALPSGGLHAAEEVIDGPLRRLQLLPDP